MSEHDSLKQEYLKFIQQKKKDYIRENKEFIRQEDSWKTLVLDELIRGSERYQDSRSWKKLINFTHHCKTNDSRWRSNVLWFDFLQTFSESFSNSSLTEFIKSHMENRSEHYVAAIIFVFSRSYIKYSDIKDQNSFNSKIEELKYFIKIILQCIIHYYGGIVARYMTENTGEMYDMVLDILFRSKLSCFLLKHYIALHPNEKYWNKLNALQGLKCTDLGIDFNFQLEREGYEPAIIQLRNIETVHSPIQKMDAIYKTTRVICHCVDEFWKDSEDISYSELVISSDQVISIILYVSIQAMVKNLHAHVWMVKEFGRRSMQNSATGYYLTTIEACAEQITEMDPDNPKKR